MNPRRSYRTSDATTLGCVVTAVALFIFAIIVGAGISIGWGLFN